MFKFEFKKLKKIQKNSKNDKTIDFLYIRKN